MKNKLFLSLFSSVVFFNSCSNNEDLPSYSTRKQKLLRSIFVTHYDNSFKPKYIQHTFRYNPAGEVVKITSQEGLTTFEYSNGKPSKINYYNDKEQLIYYNTFTYNNDKLAEVKAIYANSEYNRTTTYTYNSNGQLIGSILCQSPDCSKQSTISYTYDGDNISTETSTTGGTLNSIKKDFFYDNRYSPFTDTNKYLRIAMGGAYSLSKNNYTTEKISYKNDDGTWTQKQTNYYIIEYDSNGLPQSVVGKDAKGNDIVDYYYQYDLN